ncbi:MAG: c-type cytochrome [Polyangiales bacterium]
MADVNRRDEFRAKSSTFTMASKRPTTVCLAGGSRPFLGPSFSRLGIGFYYQVYEVAPDRMTAYQEEAAAARAAQGVRGGRGFGADVQRLVDRGALGKATFDQQCVACHNDKAQGRDGLGPNLTDNFWLHGGSPTDIYRTVTDGVPAKGMVPWGPTLGQDGVKHVVAYLLTVRNTNVSGERHKASLGHDRILSDERN